MFQIVVFLTADPSISEPMSKKLIIVWLRQDLRTADNPALHAAAATGQPVLPLFILDDEAAGRWRLGGAARWFTHQALATLDLPVVLRHGDSATVLDQLIEETGADAVFWNRRYEPLAIAQDKAIKTDLTGRGLDVQSFAGFTLREPWEVQQQGGGAYKVYSPYARMWLKGDALRQPLDRPEIKEFAQADGLDLLELALLPKAPDWSGGLADAYKVSEQAAEDLLTDFREAGLFAYSEGRNLPGENGTSSLSAYLATGVISPHRVYQAAAAAAFGRSGGLEPAMPFIRQLIWRDFAHANLFHFPDLPETSLRKEFERYPWADDAVALKAWQRGSTGFPIVDAGMRQLWQTGYMHNRVRMIAGSFLTKDLLIHWRKGEAWFWDTLVDANLANNAMGWQWVAGSGIDAAPYFRIFNPTTQAEKFDSHGHYVRRFVPELAELPNKWIHRPAEAPPEVLAKAGVKLGKTYPKPMLDHAAARQRALNGYERIKAER